MLRGIRNIVRLSERFANREDNIEPDIRGISDSTGTLPMFLTMEPDGRILPDLRRVCTSTAPGNRQNATSLVGHLPYISYQ